jgi:16S rRNA G966 N2-methylase RsmD
VEADRRAAAAIEANAATLGADGVVVRCGSVASVLAAGTARPVDLVFADPPYEVTSAEVELMLGALSDGGWVGPGAIAVVERPASAPPLAWPVAWTPGRDRRYGDTRLEFGEIA